ncbi:PERM1 protein, partial [Dicaeum eximium]|nr:PERM1 protein [Dicaeum eximium]
MDNFEYSIQLSDREWAEFLAASEECSLATAALATGEEQSLGDIEQGDASGRHCPLSSARQGTEPEPGTASPAPRGGTGDTGDTALRLPGSGDEAEPGSGGDSDRPAGAAMPSAQRRQPPRPPMATPGGGTAQGTEVTAAGDGRATEPSGSPEQGGDRGGGQAPLAPHGATPEGTCATPGAVAQPGAGPAEKSAVPSEPGLRGPAGDPPSASLVAAEDEKGDTEPGSPGVVRPKVPAQPRKSRKQRGASGTEGDRDTATPAGKAAPGSPVSPRKGRGKDKAGRAALLRLGSEEAAENKRSVPGPDGGDAGAAPPRQRGKEPGAQSPGKVKATKSPRAGQAGGSGVRDSVPVVPAGEASQEIIEIPRIPAAEIPRIPTIEIPCEPAEGIPTIPGAGIPVIPGAGIPWEAAAEVPPRARSPLGSARCSSLDVTWPEMYEYLFCDSQEEEEELGSSLEGRKSPLPREISWPELYEYFFNEAEGSRKKGKAKDRKRKKQGGLERSAPHKDAPSSAPGGDTVLISVPDVYGHFFPERAHSRVGWRGIFSTTPASEVKKAVGALRAMLQRQIQLGGGQAPSSQALVPRRSGEELALVPLGGAQVWPGDADTALALRGKCSAEDPRVLSHKDMCLVFCAFASWAVKTSDLQAPDAWKTMFLASFGTLSAIRYFRRQLREGHPRI